MGRVVIDALIVVSDDGQRSDEIDEALAQLLQSAD
jgi:hypothetical protein